jgi:lipooligosaccharide transport system ATP-binding protein
VAIARAMLAEPQVLILDEPTTGLDPQFRHDLWQRLLDLRARGITLLLTTHYMEEAERLCDRLVIMNEGKIAATGSPAELIRTTVPPAAVEVRATAAERARIARELAPEFGTPEQYSDRLVYYTTDGDRVLLRLRDGGYSVLSEIARRTTIEDVFLRLTGRELNP